MKQWTIWFDVVRRVAGFVQLSSSSADALGEQHSEQCFHFSSAKMDEKSYYSRLFIALVMVLLFGVIVLQYVCPTSDCQLLRLASLSSRLGSRAPGDRAGNAGDPYSSEDGALARFVPRYNFTTTDLHRVVNFNMKENDVIVFLHIQKTGGTTFGRHLVRNIQLERPCECHAGQKKCACYRPGKRDTWLFSRFSTGWSCGLHADWTELTNCVPSFMSNRESQERRRTPRNYYYITILRDPVWRYLSEWRHVQRGATWKASKHMCDGRLPTLNELPSCYNGDDWSGCTLEEFMACPYNLASNRQTRMLADLSLVGCYNLSIMSENQRWALLLESAKRNLRNMAFFGLTEYQRKTQYLFEHTFRLSFIAPFTQLNGTRATSVEVELETQRRIRELNQWDVELYEYARDLFLQRFQYARQQERREARQLRIQERRKLRAKVRPWWGLTDKGVFNPTNAPQQTEQYSVSFSEDKQVDTEKKLERESEGQEEDTWLEEDDNETMLDYLENVEQWR